MAKENPFKEGQVVQLKSSDLDMTIDSFETDPLNPNKIYAVCVWHDNRKPYREKYNIDSLHGPSDDSTPFEIFVG